jgi:hypothetical protein
MVTRSFDVDINFWKVNQDLKSIGPFKDLYESDKSKDKSKSSDIMYFIAFCYDQESKFYKLPLEEKHKDLGKDIMGDEKFFSKNQKNIKAAIDFYIKLDDDTPAKRGLRIWEKKMDERSKFIDETEIEDFETAEKLDKLMGNNKKLYDDYFRIMEDLAKEDSNTQGRGGKELSLGDLGEI